MHLGNLIIVISTFAITVIGAPVEKVKKDTLTLPIAARAPEAQGYAVRKSTSDLADFLLTFLAMFVV